MTELGLVIGGLGGLAVPGSRLLAWASATLLGAGGALGGGFVAGLLFGSGFSSAGFSGTRLALAGVVSALLVCCWTLYLRERRLPR